MCHPHNLNEFKYLQNFQFFYFLFQPTSSSRFSLVVTKLTHYNIQLLERSSWGHERSETCVGFQQHHHRHIFPPQHNSLFTPSKQPSCCLVKISNLCRLSSLSREILILFTQKPPTWRGGGFIVVLAVYCSVERQLDVDDGETQRHTKNIVCLGTLHSRLQQQQQQHWSSSLCQVMSFFDSVFLFSPLNCQFACFFSAADTVEPNKVDVEKVEASSAGSDRSRIRIEFSISR